MPWCMGCANWWISLTFEYESMRENSKKLWPSYLYFFAIHLSKYKIEHIVIAIDLHTNTFLFKLICCCVSHPNLLMYFLIVSWNKSKYKHMIKMWYAYPVVLMYCTWIGNIGFKVIKRTYHIVLVCTKTNRE